MAVGLIALGAAGCGRGAAGSAELPTFAPIGQTENGATGIIPTNTAENPTQTQQGSVTDAEREAVKQACADEAKELGVSGEVVVKTLDKNKSRRDDPQTHFRMKPGDDAEKLEGVTADGTGYEPVMAADIDRNEIVVVDLGAYNCTITKALVRQRYLDKMRSGNGISVTGETEIFASDGAFLQPKR